MTIPLYTWELEDLWSYDAFYLTNSWWKENKMDKELTTSKIENNQFHLGQLELSLIVKRIIRHYQYHNNNQSPEAVVIPLLKEVDGVEIKYEKEVLDTKPTTRRAGSRSNPDNS